MIFGGIICIIKYHIMGFCARKAEKRDIMPHTVISWQVQALFLHRSGNEKYQIKELYREVQKND